MSIRAMNWAWQAPLPPGPKIVLLALADIADDEGVCWPGHRALAVKCSTTVRTVQRTIAALAAQGRLLIEPRYRNDGSRSSNRYRLPIDTPHDKLSAGGDTGVAGPLTPVSWPPDAGVVARTTNEPSLDTPLLPVATQSDTVVVDKHEWIFPAGLTETQRAGLAASTCNVACRDGTGAPGRARRSNAGRYGPKSGGLLRDAYSTLARRLVRAGVGTVNCRCSSSTGSARSPTRRAGSRDAEGWKRRV